MIVKRNDPAAVPPSLPRLSAHGSAQGSDTAAPRTAPTSQPQFRALTGELVVRLAAQQAPVDHDLVADIRDALARGEYPVDARKIAAAMIALDLDGGR